MCLLLSALLLLLAAQVNEVYLKFFTKNPPARSCFAVAGLPRGGLVEIEAIALVSGSKL